MVSEAEAFGRESAVSTYGCLSSSSASWIKIKNLYPSITLCFFDLLLL